MVPEEIGWLDPDGTFRSCGYTWHIDSAREWYGTYDEEEIADRGVVKIFWDPVHHKTDYYAKRILTEEQIKVLKERNLKIYEEDLPHE